MLAYVTGGDDTGRKVLKQYGGENWVRGFGAHGFYASAPDLAKLMGVLLPTVPYVNWLVQSPERMLGPAPGTNLYTIGGFRLPDPKSSRHYFSKSGAEVGTECFMMFPRDGATSKFDDLVAVVLINSDIKLQDLGDPLYDLFEELDKAGAWPDYDLFPGLDMRPYEGVH